MESYMELPSSCKPRKWTYKIIDDNRDYHIVKVTACKLHRNEFQPPLKWQGRHLSSYDTYNRVATYVTEKFLGTGI